MNAPVTSIGTVTAVDSNAVAIGSHAETIVNDEIRVALTGIPDNKRVVVRVANINNAALDATASVGFLVGDVSNSQKVTASDIMGVKRHLSTAINTGNFLFDLNLSGLIDAADLSAVKLNSAKLLQ
jgi:hypothetical protein